MPTLQGTLLLPNGAPLANANIVLIADRNEGANIVKGVSSEFSTNASGVYSQSVEPGLYSVKLEHQQRTRTLGKIFIDPTTNSSLEVLLVASDDAETVTVTALQTFLSDTQAAADSAAQSADDAINALAENQAQLDAFIEQAQSDVNAAVAAANSAALAANDVLSVIPRIGRLTESRGGVPDESGLLVNEFTGFGQFLTPFNGASSFTAAGKFINNNATFGGTGQNLTATVIQLLGAMGRFGDDARFGSEFYVGEITAGGLMIRENSLYSGHYLLTSNLDYVLSSNSFFAAWICVVSGQLSTRLAAYLDGDFKNSVFIQDNNWHYLSVQQVITSRGVVLPYPHLYALPGSVIQVALPNFFYGAHNNYIAVTPE